MHEYAGFGGPWVENHWIKEFCCDKPLEEFGGLVPVFVQWVDLFVASANADGKQPVGFGTYAETFARITKLLRPDVLYVTVSQCDNGIYPEFLARNVKSPKDVPHHLTPAAVSNLLVLSAGGFGHVPIPLLLRDQELLPPLTGKEDITMSFVGRPHYIRREVVRRLREAQARASAAAAPPSNFSSTHYYGSDWINIVRRSTLNLTPRGYGRSAFHLAEVVQMGRVPVYVWDDVPWLPYRGSATAHVATSLGWSVNIRALPTFIDHVARSLASESTRAELTNLIAAKAANARAVRDSHYSYAGVMNHIRAFLADPLTSELQCEPHPLRGSVSWMWAEGELLLPGTSSSSL